MLDARPRRFVRTPKTKTAESGNKRIHVFCGMPIYACGVEVGRAMACALERSANAPISHGGRSGGGLHCLGWTALTDVPGAAQG
jgi:hypothetical protein